MPPSQQHMHQQKQQQRRHLARAALELDALRSAGHTIPEARFPMACRALLYSIEGNDRCVDCGAAHPQWASITYGSLLCLHCSGYHRSLGVARSKVRSIDMDHWTHAQVLQMLEGGNAQLSQFFQRHRMAGPTLADNQRRYRTKAAFFYRTQLALHVGRVAQQGAYPGRDAARQPKSCDADSPTTSRQPLESPKSMIFTAA